MVFFLTTITSAATGSAQLIAQLNADNPFAQFSADAQQPQNVGGCYKPPATEQLLASAESAPFTFTDEELRIAREEPVSIDWRKHGAVGPVRT